jgi:hypothetical protein
MQYRQTAENQEIRRRRTAGWAAASGASLWASLAFGFAVALLLAARASDDHQQNQRDNEAHGGALPINGRSMRLNVLTACEA